jgi:hypothetical protein
VEAKSTGGQGSRRAVAASDDDDDDDDDDDVLYSKDKRHNQDKKVQIKYRE